MALDSSQPGFEHMCVVSSLRKKPLGPKSNTASSPLSRASQAPTSLSVLISEVGVTGPAAQGSWGTE